MHNSEHPKTELLCLFGGKSTEYEVSLRSAYSVLKNLSREKYHIHMAGVTRTGAFYYYSGDAENIPSDRWSCDPAFLSPLKFCPGSDFPICYEKDGRDLPLKIDVIFPVMHGTNCEDGRLQGMLELLCIPFVGPGCVASAVCMDKTLTKMVLEHYHIPQARSLFFLRTDIMNSLETLVQKAEAAFTYPMFIKPSSAGSSVGAAPASDRQSLIKALQCAAQYDEKVLVEEYMDAREVEVAVLGNGADITASTPGEIDPGSEFYDYDTKYNRDTASYFIPARLSENTRKRLCVLAKQIYRALGCKGLSRVDFFVSKGAEEAIVFNEINTLPGFTSISMYAKMFAYDGVAFSELCDRLIALALENHAV